MNQMNPYQTIIAVRVLAAMASAITEIWKWQKSVEQINTQNVPNLDTSLKVYAVQD